MLGKSYVMLEMKFLNYLRKSNRLRTLVTVVGWSSSVIAFAFTDAGLYYQSPTPIIMSAKSTIAPTCNFIFDA